MSKETATFKIIPTSSFNNRAITRRYAVVAYFMYCLDIRLEGLRETDQNLSRDSECPSRDSNQVPSEYKLRVFSVLQQPRTFKFVSCL